MGRLLGRLPLKCAARTHAVQEDERLIRVRCKDKTCPEAADAKARGLKLYHVFDTETFLPAEGTFLNWPEYEPDDRQPKE